MDYYQSYIGLPRAQISTLLKQSAISQHPKLCFFSDILYPHVCLQIAPHVVHFPFAECKEMRGGSRFLHVVFVFFHVKH